MATVISWMAVFCGEACTAWRKNISADTEQIREDFKQEKGRGFLYQGFSKPALDL